MNKCNKCNIKFKSGAEKVGCGFCSKWQHATCAGISAEMFNQLCTENQLHWYCKECNAIAPGVIAVVQKCTKDNAKLLQEVQDLKTELKEVKEEIQDMKDGNEETFVETVKKLAKAVYEEEQVESKPIQQTNEVIRSIARREVHENNDKKGRETNLVLFNVDEEKEDEEKEVTEILAYLEVDVEVRGIRRMGREKKAGKTRPIWVKLASKQERNSVLDKAKNLRTSNLYKEIFINKDMTQQERDAAHKLREELKEKRKNEREGQSKYFIRRGRVIRVDEGNNDRESDTEEDGSKEDEDEG